MKLKNGKIDFLVNQEGAEITLHDSDANAVFAKINLSPEQLCKVLSRLCRVECEIEVLNLEKIGTKHEKKTFEFEFNEGDIYMDRGALAYTKAKELLKDSEWKPDKYFNSQDSFFTKDGIKMARCTIRRWVKDTI